MLGGGPCSEDGHARRCAPKREGREGRPPGRPAPGDTANSGSPEAESLSAGVAAGGRTARRGGPGARRGARGRQRPARGRHARPGWFGARRDGTPGRPDPGTSRGAIGGDAACVRGGPGRRGAARPGGTPGFRRAIRRADWGSANNNPCLTPWGAGGLYFDRRPRRLRKVGNARPTLRMLSIRRLAIRSAA